jgi:hypothetical protein
MKTLLIAMMLGSTAMTGVALAQTTTAPVTNATEPTDTASQMEGGFITWQGQDQMIASNLMSAAVWGAGNEPIGTVDDLLLDREGQIIAIIVGVGGFLGIGEKKVAISNDQLEFVLTQDVLAAGNVPGAPAGTGTQDPALAPQAGGMTAGGTTAPAPAGTVVPDQTGTAGTTTSDATGMAPGAEGSTGAGTAGTVVPDQAGTAGTTTSDATGMAPGAEGSTGAGVGSGMTATGINGWTGSVIDHIQVNYTREQLRDAPAFEAVE